MKIKNLIGQRFGLLIVIKRLPNIGQYIQWLCLCNCGTTKIVRGSSLTGGHTKSCGCFQEEVRIKFGKLNYKHGYANKNSRMYLIWSAMKHRCNNKNNKKYKNYGARGITVCERWSNKKNGFQNFLEDVGEIPKRLTLDRINNNGNYEPNNWRLATRKEQNRNTRSNIMIPFEGKDICLKDYCKIKNLNYNTIARRINTLGWSIKRAVTTPVNIKFRHRGE